MVIVYLVDEAKVLLLYNPGKERWEPVRGALQDHELPEEAAVRLMKEQLNVKTDIVGSKKILGEHVMLTDPIAMLTEHADARHEHIQFVFAARLAEPVHEDVHWIDARWFSREDLKTEQIPKSVRACAALAVDASQRENETERERDEQLNGES